MTATSATAPTPTIDPQQVAPDDDRVREHTDPEVLARLDQAMVDRIRELAQDPASPAGRMAISQRIDALEREWDIERVLEANAGTLALLGTWRAIRRGRAWSIVPLVVTGFLIQHAVQGWCPPMVVLRRLGLRSRQEIEVERWALKLLRGDADHLPPAGSVTDRVNAVLVALAG
ncbi:MAG: hypothetical protein ACO1PW_09240 [Actinomycetota bacterium]